MQLLITETLLTTKIIFYNSFKTRQLQPIILICESKYIFGSIYIMIEPLICNREDAIEDERKQMRKKRWLL